MIRSPVSAHSYHGTSKSILLVHFLILHLFSCCMRSLPRPRNWQRSLLHRLGNLRAAMASSMARFRIQSVELVVIVVLVGLWDLSVFGQFGQSQSQSGSLSVSGQFGQLDAPAEQRSQVRWPLAHWKTLSCGTAWQATHLSISFIFSCTVASLVVAIVSSSGVVSIVSRVVSRVELYKLYQDVVKQTCCV